MSTIKELQEKLNNAVNQYRKTVSHETLCRGKSKRAATMRKILDALSEKLPPKQIGAHLQRNTTKDQWKTYRLTQRKMSNAYGLMMPVAREENIPAYRLQQLIKAKKMDLAAVKIADAFHNNIGSLYVSKYAFVHYGNGGVSHEYDRHKKYGARTCQLAGVKIVGTSLQDAILIIETHRGKEVFRSPLSNFPKFLKNVTQCGSIDGDLYSVRQAPGEAIRYDIKHKKTGVALYDKNTKQWGHGRTFQDCARELKRKRALATAKRLEQGKRIMLGELLPRAIDQGLAWLADLPVSYKIARQAGLCDQGIRLFCARHGFSVENGATVGEIVSTGNPLGIKACRLAVEKQILAAV